MRFKFLMLERKPRKEVKMADVLWRWRSLGKPWEGHCVFWQVLRTLRVVQEEGQFWVTGTVTSKPHTALAIPLSRNPFPGHWSYPILGTSPGCPFTTLSLQEPLWPESQLPVTPQVNQRPFRGRCSRTGTVMHNAAMSSGESRNPAAG